MLRIMCLILGILAIGMASAQPASAARISVARQAETFPPLQRLYTGTAFGVIGWGNQVTLELHVGWTAEGWQSLSGGPYPSYQDINPNIFLDVGGIFNWSGEFNSYEDVKLERRNGTLNAGHLGCSGTQEIVTTTHRVTIGIYCDLGVSSDGSGNGILTIQSTIEDLVTGEIGGENVLFFVFIDSAGQ